MGQRNSLIYCDCNATTPVDPEVLAAMVPYFTEQFGNPSSSTHAYGWSADAAVEAAREAIAKAINADAAELVFTSGATEANNLAIKGVAETYLQQGRHLITVATEHRAVLDPMRYLERLGFELTVLPVDGEGLIDLAQLKDAIREDTILVSVMAVNNEIGVLQPLAEIGQLLREFGESTGRKPLFHTDAAQAIGKVPLDVDALGIDLMSLTAHKIYGPKGVGALYVRRRNPRVVVAPQLHGGGQERDRRSGTLNPPLIVGFAKALELAHQRLDADTDHLLKLRSHLWTRLSGSLDNIVLNGSFDHRVAGNLNISFGSVDSASLLLGVRSVVALSSGSACSSGRKTPSHVLIALGRPAELARSSLRFGFCRTTTMTDVEEIATCVIEVVSILTQPNSTNSINPLGEKA